MALTPQKYILEQNSQLPTPPKVWVCSFPSVDGNGKLVSAIMKNQKNGSNSPKMHHRVKLPITDPPKVWVCGFPSVDRIGKLVSGIMKNQKNGSNSPKMHPRAKWCWTRMYEPACVILTLLDILSFIIYI